MSMMLTIFLLMVMGAATAYLAYQRGRDPYMWFVIGIFFGVLAMLLLVILPVVTNEEELKAQEKSKELVDRREEQMKEQEKLENAPNLQPQSVETNEWFYLDKTRQQQGPFSFYVINELWEGAEINAHTLVWTDGMAEWKQIQDTPNLHHVLEGLESENRKAFPEDL